MAVFPDTSALAKLYHHEIGTELVERIVDGSPGQCFISRLGETRRSLYSRPLKIAAITRELRRPWKTATTHSGFLSGA